MKKRYWKFNISMIQIVVFIFFLANSIFALDVSYTTSEIELCGINPNSKMINLGSVSLNESINTLTIKIISQNTDTKIDNEDEIEISISDYIKDSDISLGTKTISSTCVSEIDKSFTLNIYNDSDEIYNTTLININVTILNQSNNPPNIIYKSPQGLLNENDIKLRIDTDKDSLCKYDLSQTNYNNMNYFFNGDGFSHYSDLTLDDGDYSFNIICKDSDNAILSLKKTIEFTISSNPPQITDNYPKETYSSTWDKTLEITTDIESTCYYSYDKKNNPDAMTMFDFNDITEHLTEYDTSYNHIYIICKDSYNRYNPNPYRIDLEMEESVEATIILDKDTPLSTGLVKVNLVFNENVEDPSLEYSIVGGNKIPIPLEGEGTDYQGYMNIVSSSSKQIAEFSASINDDPISINKGKFFIIDSLKPTTLNIIRIIEEKNYIDLKWIDQSDDTMFYKIYRKIDEDHVNQLDYYDKTTETYFEDYDVKDGKTYYYRISAIDQAGNEGFLSNEYYLTFGTRDFTDSTDYNNQNNDYTDKNILTLEEVKTLTRLKSDYNELKTNINSIQNIDNFKLLKETQHYTTYNNLKSDIDKSIDDINNMLQTETFSITTTQLLDTEIETINKKINLLPKAFNSSKTIDIEIKDYIEDKHYEYYLEKKRLEINSQTLRLAKKNLIKTDELNKLFDIKAKKINISFDDNKESITKLSISSDIEEKILMFIDFKDIIEDPTKISNTNAKYRPIKYEKNMISLEDIKSIYFNLETKRSLKDINNIKIIAFYINERPKNNLISGSAILDNINIDNSSVKKGSIILILLLIIAYMAYQYFKIDNSPGFNVPEPEIDENYNNKDLEKNNSFLKEKKDNLIKNLKNIPSITSNIIHKNSDDFEKISKKDEKKEDKFSKKIVMKKDFFKNVEKDKAFLTINNKNLTNFIDLINFIDTSDNTIFSNHVNEDKNDFYNWIKDCFYQKELADKIKDIKDKKLIKNMIIEHFKKR